MSSAPKQPTRAREQPTGGASSRALLGGHSFYADPLVRRPRTFVASRARLAGLLHCRVDDLPAMRGPGARGDLPLTFLVGELVAELKLHRERAACRGLGLRRGRRLPLRTHFDFGPRGAMVSGRLLTAPAGP